MSLLASFLHSHHYKIPLCCFSLCIMFLHYKWYEIDLPLVAKTNFSNCEMHTIVFYIEIMYKKYMCRH